MNLGEKTDIRTGISQTSGRHEEPLESYIPGVGRKNRSSSVGMTGDYAETNEPYHPTSAQHSEEKPLESYIPGVGRRNHPVDPELAKEGKMGHTTSAQPPAPEKISKDYASEPHIPGTGRITEPPQQMKRSSFSADEMTAARMDSQHITPSSQTTTIPGFESEGKTRIPGTEISKQSYRSDSDTIDRENLPRPAHLSESANTGVNAPARGDSRKLSDFHEPSDLGRDARRESNREENPASDFPAHTYHTSKSNPGSAGSDKSGAQGTKVASEAEATHKPSQRKDSSGSGPKIFGKELHFGKSSHSQNTGEGATHSESSGPKLFGKELGFHKHHEKDQASAEGSHSGPKIFGKELSFGKKQQEHGHETKEPSTGTRSGGSISGGDRRASTGSAEDKSKQYPSTVPTVEDQPVKGNPPDRGAKKTDRSLSIGSEEASSYAKNVGNMPSMVDPSVPTYRHKEEITETIGEGGAYKVHSENITERKVSVGSHENEPHAHGSHEAGLSTGRHHDVSHEHENKEPKFEYGPESVPRSHQQKDTSEEHKAESHQGHSGVIGTIKKVLSHHSNE